MAFLYVTQYGGVSLGANGAQAPEEPPILAERIAIGATSVQSTVFSAGCELIEVHTDAICAVAIDASPTAVATSRRMAADTTRYYGVKPGQKIAVITAS